MGGSVIAYYGDQERRLELGTRTGGRTMNRTKLALKVLKYKRARQIAVRALKNKRVRGVVAKQVSRRLLGR
jgi:hypothetical protein